MANRKISDFTDERTLAATDRFEVAVPGNTGEFYATPEGIKAYVNSGASTLAARVEASTSTTIPNTALTAASFNTVIRDNGGFYSAGNPTRLTVPSGGEGWYVISGQMFVAPAASGPTSAVSANNYALLIRKNGSSFIAQFRDQLNSETPGFNIPTIDYLVAGDYIEIAIFHNAGSTLVTRTDTGQLSYLAATRIAASSSVGAQLGTANVFTKAQRVAPVALTISSGSITIDTTLSNIFTLSLTANITSVNITGLAAGTNFSIHVDQNGTGGRTISGWPTSVKWAGGVSPVLTSTALAADLLSFESHNGTTLKGTYAQNFS